MSLNKKRGQSHFSPPFSLEKNDSDPFFLIKNALREDIGSGDITSQIIIPKAKKVRAALFLKEKAIVCGLDIAREVFRAVDGSIKFQAKSKDGNLEKAGKIIARIQGNARSILKAERTALNLLSHLTGIATLTGAFVEAVRPYKARIYDTRKTIPGLRQLQKYAVKTGGGYNHRMGLYDGILIKDNHIAVSAFSCQPSAGQKAAVGPPIAQAAGQKAAVGPPIAQAAVSFKSLTTRSPSLVRELAEIAKKKRPKGLKVEIEVINLAEFKEALKARPDIIMLDNMKTGDMEKAVRIREHQSIRASERQTLIEVSGGVNLANVRAIAASGVDIISIGALTHSAKAVDISLEV